MEYIQYLNAIENALNNKGFNSEFKNAIAGLKNDYGVVLTTEFLSNMLNLNGQQKNKRVYYMLNSCGFKTEKVLNPQKTFISKLVKKEVINYGYKNGAVKILDIYNIETIKSFKVNSEKTFYKLI